jgi:hypothetical protein
MQPDERVGVIKDRDGHFVNVRQTKGGYYYTIYSGITTGFTFYDEASELTMKNDLKVLKALNEGFRSEYINYHDIPEGVRIHSN